jgi:outer membrane protein
MCSAAKHAMLRPHYDQPPTGVSMSKKYRIFPRPLAAAIAAIMMLAAGQAVAEQGDWIARVGAANVDPDASSDILDIDVDDDTQVGLTFAYMVTDNIGVGLLAATPFEHTIVSKELDLKVGSAKQLPPTLSLQYYFLGSDSKFRPYAGIGVNYTYFWDEDVAGEFEAVAGESSLSLDDSWGLSLQAGADYYINDKWLVNAAIWKLDIETDATVQTENLGRVDVSVDVDPWVYMIGIGYRF